MREAVIVASSRTGLAKSFRGSFNLTRPDDMAAHCVKDLLKKVPQLEPSEVEDVVMGTGFPEGPQGFNVGRNVALLAGLPVTVPGGTVSRFCSSGLNAVMVAAHMVQVEGYDVIIGGGLDSITLLQTDVHTTNRFNPYYKDHHTAIYMPMGQTAEIVAERYKVSREAQDRYALLSQQRTAAAQREGKFKDEIAPMKATMEVTDKATGQKSKKEVVVDRDECNRPDTTLEGLAKLPPAFKEGGTVTAGNSSQFSDGASATLIMSAERAKALGVRPLGFFRGCVFAACEPDEMGIGPVFAGGRSAGGSSPCASAGAWARPGCSRRRTSAMKAAAAKSTTSKQTRKEPAMAESVYKIIELVGTSTDSWEKAAKAAVERASKTLRDLRIAEISQLDMHLENGKVLAYRAKVKVSFKYED